MAIKVVIKWLTKDVERIAKMRRYFNLPDYTTINGLTPGSIEDDKLITLKKAVERGLIGVWETEWSFNGISYSWKCQ